MSQSTQSPSYQRYARSFFLALCLLQWVSYVYAFEDLTTTQQRAEQGDAEAQYNLGVRYHFGEGVAQDDQQAVAWFRKAAEQGHANAQLKLGVSYAQGEGVTQDYQQAYAWLSVAAANGYSGASEPRDLAAKKLSKSQLESAQKLAGQYFEKYQPGR